MMIRKDRNVLQMGFWCKMEVLMVFFHRNLTYDAFLEYLGTGQYIGSIMITMLMIRNIKNVI